MKMDTIRIKNLYSSFRLRFQRKQVEHFVKIGVDASLLSGCVEKTVKTVEQTSPVSGGIEEVVDGVEEEDEEAEDGEDSVRVNGIPGWWVGERVKVECSKLHR